MKKSIRLALAVTLALLAFFSLPAFAKSKPVKKVKLDKTKLTMYVGESAQLTATVTPAGADTKVVWSSSDSKVVTVYKKGKLKAKKAGTATITCASKKYPKKKATCKVTVKEVVKVTKITLKPDKVTLSAGESRQLTASVAPAKATYKDVKWKSSDTNVATVTKDGLVETKAAGEVKITCTSARYPGIKAICKVTVEKPKVTDGEELEKAIIVLAKTSEPFYLMKQGNKVSSQTGANGITKWSVGRTANGVAKFVKVYDENYNLLGYTRCNAWGGPSLTSRRETETQNDLLKAGTYNFKDDPAQVLIGWVMFAASTTQEEFEKSINASISAEVFEKVKARNSNSYWYSQNGGGSCIIIYGKNGKGELVGKYAGVMSYNMYSNAAYYSLVGINQENTQDYGQIKSGSAKW